MFRHNHNVTKKNTVILKLKKRERDPNQTALYNFWPQIGSEKRSKTDNVIRCAQDGDDKASIIIPFRDDGAGKGAYYDHYTMQQITGNPTVISTTAEKPIDTLIDHLRTVTHDIQIGMMNTSNHRTIPPVINELDKIFGLVLIPGVARNTFEGKAGNFDARHRHEQMLIKNAYNRGQPMLGICGGSWVIWESFNGIVENVNYHNCRAGMPRIKDSTGKVGHNVQVHRIKIDKKAYLLKAALQIDNTTQCYPSVNSVHWQAPSSKKIPDIFMVSATSTQDTKLPAKAESEEDTIEAFESKYGAPILGIQWHPEAYTNNCPAEYLPHKQQCLIKYMVYAGQAYKNKQKLLGELNEKFNAKSADVDFKLSLNKTGFFLNSNCNRVQRSGDIKFKVLSKEPEDLGQFNNPTYVLFICRKKYHISFYDKMKKINDIDLTANITLRELIEKLSEKNQNLKNMKFSKRKKAIGSEILDIRNALTQHHTNADYGCKLTIEFKLFSRKLGNNKKIHSSVIHKDEITSLILRNESLVKDKWSFKKPRQ